MHAAPSGHDGGCGCQACGRALREIGQDVSEVLNYEPSSFYVARHVRPRLACSGCKTITQTAAPSRPVQRGMAGPGLLAHVLVGKYADSLPLYRQCQIYAREGVMLERSILTDWVGQAARLLTPLAQAIGRRVLRADKIHGDDTPIRVLGGKGNKAKTGRLWVYVRDDRPAGLQAPPAVWFQYSPGRHGEHPARHLLDWQGILQADAFAGYNQLYEDGRIIEAACWSHARRKLWDIHERQHKLPGTLAHQGLERIAKIFKIEAEIRGKSVLRRERVRQVRTQPILKELQAWMGQTLQDVSAKSPLAQAIGYAVPVLADLTGAALKALGLNNDLSASADYTASQAWARAIHGANPRWDGMRYVSRQLNKGFAHAIFERCGLHKLRAEKLKARQVDELCNRFNVTAV